MERTTTAFSSTGSVASVANDRKLTAMLFAVHVSLAVCVFVLGMNYQPQSYEWFHLGLMGVNMGIGFGQILALCAWTAFGTGSYLKRMLTSMLFIALAFHLAWLIISIWLRNEQANYVNMGSGCIGAILFFTLLQVPYWTLRRFKRWRIVHQSLPPAKSDPSRATFGVVDVFAWITYLAVPLALAGGVFATTNDGFLQTIVAYFIMMIPSLQSLIVVWLAVGPRRSSPRRYIPVLLLLSLAFAISMFISQAFTMYRYDWNSIVEFVKWNWKQLFTNAGIAIGVILPVGLSMLLVSRCGYQLRTHATDVFVAHVAHRESVIGSLDS